MSNLENCEYQKYFRDIDCLETNHLGDQDPRVVLKTYNYLTLLFVFKLVYLSQTWLAFSLQHNNRLHNVTVYNTFLGFWISQYAFLSVLETSIWGIKLIGSLPKQILVYEHRVLFWYCNETKNHPATAIQSMDMGDSILLRYLFILVHMQLISKIGCMVGNWICSVQQVMCPFPVSTRGNLLQHLWNSSLTDFTAMQIFLHLIS